MFDKWSPKPTTIIPAKSLIVVDFVWGYNQAGKPSNANFYYSNVFRAPTSLQSIVQHFLTQYCDWCLARNLTPRDCHVLAAIEEFHSKQIPTFLRNTSIANGFILVFDT